MQLEINALTEFAKLWSPTFKAGSTEELKIHLIDTISSDVIQRLLGVPGISVEQINSLTQRFIEDLSKSYFSNNEDAANGISKRFKDYNEKMANIFKTEMQLHTPPQGKMRLREMMQRTHLVTQKGHHDIYRSLEDALTKNIAKIEVATRLSEELDCPIDKITERDIEEKIAKDKHEEAERREQCCQELLQEAELEKKQKVLKNEKSKTTPQKQNQKKNSVFSKNLPSASTRPLSQAELLSKYTLSFYGRPSMSEHPRVTKRWRTKNVDEIRNFEDTLASGERVKRYEGLNESQIRYMRACHYLPGIEKIFANEQDKKIYTFRTESGIGMAAILRFENQMHYGFITFGISSNGVLYHRFFEKTDPNQLFQAIQRSGKEFSPIAPLNQAEKWTATSTINFEISEDGAIHVSYPEEDHSITIFPIRKKLMSAELFAK